MIKPVSIPRDDLLDNLANLYANKLFRHSKKMKPRFGGTLDDHKIGKLGELAFEEFCKENHLPIVHSPLRRNYRRLRIQDDFIIDIFGKRKKIEVKTRTYIQNKPLFYNKSQYDEKEHYNYYVVFAEVRRYSVVLLGWIPASEIAKYPIRKDIPSPAYVIPVKALRDLRVFVVGKDAL